MAKKVRRKLKYEMGEYGKMKNEKQVEIEIVECRCTCSPNNEQIDK